MAYADVRAEVGQWRPAGCLNTFPTFISTFAPTDPVTHLQFLYVSDGCLEDGSFVGSEVLFDQFGQHGLELLDAVVDVVAASSDVGRKANGDLQSLTTPPRTLCLVGSHPWADILAREGCLQDVFQKL
jgi:hypothetical protein